LLPDLYRIDPRTGVASFIATLPTGGAGIDALAFSPSGTLYGIKTVGFERFLVTIDVTAGTVSQIGSTGRLSIVSLAVAPDGTLYADNVDGDPAEGGLQTLDSSTGAATDVNPAADSILANALDFAPGGVLHSLRTTLFPNSSHVSTLSLTTGAATLVKTFAGFLNSIAFLDVPPLCDATCATCTGPASNQCTSCTAGRFLSGSQCLPCHSTCATCFGPLDNQCTSCPVGTTLTPNNTCVVPAQCGDGIVTAPEQCDDGNAANGDGCDANCTVTGCGNGVVTTGEQCDDGNAANGDGCEANCTTTPVACDATCQTCSGSTANDCLTCAAGRFLDASGACLLCHSTCQTCSGPTAGQCLTCPAGHILDAGACCPDADANNECDGDRVALLDFAALRDGDTVRLSWVTGSEVACALFEVLRCDLDSGNCPIEAHSAIPGASRVPCADSLAGATYTARDPRAPATRGFSYLLREHETTGALVHYGPLRLAAGAPEAHWTPADAPAPDGFEPPAEVPAAAGGGGCASAATPVGALAAAALLAVATSRVRRRRGPSRA
jgi:cysteine-rich repeat protein